MLREIKTVIFVLSVEALCCRWLQIQHCYIQKIQNQTTEEYIRKSKGKSLEISQLLCES